MIDLKKGFEEECKAEIQLIKLFTPADLHEGILTNMLSCYTHGVTHVLKEAKFKEKPADLAEKKGGIQCHTSAK